MSRSIPTVSLAMIELSQQELTFSCNPKASIRDKTQLTLPSPPQTTMRKREKFLNMHSLKERGEQESFHELLGFTTLFYTVLGAKDYCFCILLTGYPPSFT